MIFSVEDRLFDFFPDLQVGVLVAKIDNTRYGEDFLEAALERTRNDFSNLDFRENSSILGWSAAFEKLGMIQKHFTSSLESLIVRALKGGIFPRVNPIVDIMAAASLEFLVPVGSHDMSTLEGDMMLGFSRGYERFIPMEGGEEEFVGKDEVIYKDNHSALTRGWVWRQSNRDRVSADTTSVFIPVDILDQEISAPAAHILDRLQCYLANGGNGEVSYRNIVNRENPAAEFTL